MSKPQVIAIDGPVAVGKTTVGRLLARRLNYHFVDTGMMYRALTWKALRTGINPYDADGLTKMAYETRLSVDEEGINVDGVTVGEELRSPEVERKVSLVSMVPGVREAMVQRQRELADRGGIIMAGRDIGTVVLPEAPLKVFLTASAKERARRRHSELGGREDYETILRDLERRDELDSSRSISPLKPAPDAHIIDTENLTPEEVVDRILALIGEE